MQESETLLNYNDVAKLLKRSPNTLRVDVMKGNLPHIKIGRQVRFSKESIHEWIRKHEIQ